MRVFIAIFASLLLAQAAPADAQTSARGMYQKLQARETAARKALEAGKPSSTVRRDINRIVVGYEGIVRRYPRSGYSDNALWQAANIAADSYARYRVEADRLTSVRLLKMLIREYDSSSLVKKAGPALAALQEAAETASSSEEQPDASPASSRREPAADAQGSRSTARIRAIRRTILPEVVRIAIELDRQVEFQHDRIAGPERVFVDLAATAVGNGVSPASFDDAPVTAVRLGKRPGGATRVVLDLDDAGRYNVFTLDDPYRIVVDIRRAGAGTDAVPAAHTRRDTDRIVPAIDTAGPRASSSRANAAPAATSRLETTTVAAEDAIRPAPPVEADAALSAVPLPARSAAATPPAPAPVTPKANLKGRYSLSRQLGLGVHRIVIDPGHGGHDPGARVRGLSESELVLDVALRLEKLLLKDPGVEVVLTRRSQVFVPLEERTAIANREGADLFLSIHANASRNRKARGIETYFLNFASNPDAEAVAARENSASGRTMHSLPDIVKAIALNNKLDESRDFATLVQRAMVDHLGRSYKSVRDLGVKQAPFVVLIGAGMPSILAEISFVTHSQEGKLLKTASYRQRIAEALYQGVRRYQKSLKAVTAVASQE
jgi:N-acetylmuramoyl-L-alanine amidase